MILLPLNSSLSDAEKTITEANYQIERAEVILRNLLAVADETNRLFSIPFEDILTSLETALDILEAI